MANETPQWLYGLIPTGLGMAFTILLMWYKGLFRRLKTEAAGETRDVVGDVLLKNTIERLEETKKKTETMYADVSELKTNVAVIAIEIKNLQEALNDLKEHRTAYSRPRRRG